MEAFIILGPTFASRNVQGPATTDMYVAVCRGGLRSMLASVHVLLCTIFPVHGKTPYLPTLLLIGWVKLKPLRVIDCENLSLLDLLPHTLLSSYLIQLSVIRKW